MAERKRKCPHCGSELFTRIGFDDVEIIDDGRILTDRIKEKYFQYEYSCAKCDKDITHEELD